MARLGEVRPPARQPSPCPLWLPRAGRGPGAAPSKPSPVAAPFPAPASRCVCPSSSGLHRLPARCVGEGAAPRSAWAHGNPRPAARALFSAVLDRGDRYSVGGPSGPP
eukprot:11627897-Alexandrium_andersonii.AAC.1